MSAPLFFVDLGLPEHGERAYLTPEDTKHALRSLRLRAGDEVSLADGRSWTGRGRLVQEEGGRAAVEVTEARRVVRRAPLVSIAMAPPKGDRLAWAVQKLAEIGADELLLMDADRSVRRWRDQDRAGRVLGRLGLVAREAAMQSRRPFVMEVVGGGAVADALLVEPARAVMLWEGAVHPLQATLPGTDDTRSVRLLVGPEGGFSDGEVEAAEAAGAALATLGAGILRTETAAVVAAALALARLGRLG